MMAQNLINQIKENTEDKVLDRFFELSPDMLLTIRFDGYCEKVSQSFLDHLGYLEIEALSHPLISFLVDEDREKTWRSFQNLLEGAPAAQFENRFITKSGDVKWLAWRAIPVEEDQMVYAIARDVTEQKQMETQLEKERRTIRDQNEQLQSNHFKVEEQRALLHNKNEEILQSIRYAKRIQESLLPDENKRINCLGDHSLLFQPKDIVSGDIYWCASPSKAISLFSVIDCTGHGVPGGFLSVMGYHGLNRAVNEQKLQDPAQILGNLRSFMGNTFIDLHDGMDMSVCAIDHEKKTLKFAGANNPVYLIRAKTDQDQPLGDLPSNVQIEEHQSCYLLVIRPDKRPIGPFDKHLPFNQTEISLEKNDRVFSFSDGFLDQFGGPRNKKYQSGRFRELLASLYHLPMEQQEEALQAEFESWKGNNEQVDDVCIMGVQC